jgi:hypothetical protein
MLVRIYTTDQAELRPWRRNSKNWLILGSFVAQQANAADLYFNQTAACPCGSRNSSPHKRLLFE